MKSPTRTKRGRKAVAKPADLNAQPDPVVGEAGVKVGEQAASAEVEENGEIHSEALLRYADGYEKDRDNQAKAYEDLRFIAGEGQWDAKAEEDRKAEDRPVLVVNQCPQFVRQVTGDIRQMKPAIKVVPVDDRATKDVAAKIWPGLIRYIEQRSDAAGIYFQAADQQAGAGIGHWRVTHEREHTRTFNQEMRIEGIPDGIAVVWDPDAIRLDRSDAGWCFVPIDMSTRAFKKEWPNAGTDPLEKSPECFTDWFTDDHVRIAEYWRKVPCKRQLAQYPDGGVDDVTDDAEALERAQAAQAEIKEVDGHKVQRILMTASEILQDPEEWPGPDIPIVPLIGEEIIIGRNTIRRGVIRVVKDIQRIYNYAISTQTEVVALQPKAPFIGTEKQFEKYLDQWETANSRNWPFLEYTPDGNAPPPQRAAPPQASPGLDDLIVRTTEDFSKATGIYPSSLGAKSNEQSGKAIMARQREGDTGTYVYTDNFGRALRRTGQIIINMGPQIYDTARTIRIVGEDGKIDKLEINKPQPMVEGADANGAPTQPELLNDLTIGAYELTVEMGPGYSSKREEAREGMIALMQAAGPEIAQLYMDLFVKMQDWPLADKIAKRAQLLLPPRIQQMEAAEAGEPMPEQPPPPPPTPEQQKAMELEQEKHQELQQRNIELAHKNELDEAKLVVEKEKLEVERQKLAVERKRLDVEAKALENELVKMGVDLNTANLNHEAATVSHASTLAVAQQKAGAAEDARAAAAEAHQHDMASREQQAQADAAAAGTGEMPDADPVMGAIEQLTQQVGQIGELIQSVAAEVQAEPEFLNGPDGRLAGVRKGTRTVMLPPRTKPGTPPPQATPPEGGIPEPDPEGVLQ